MTDLADHTIAMLRKIDHKLDRVVATLDDHTQRLSRLELHTHALVGDTLRHEHRLDTFDKRLARVERRLELIE